MIVSSLWVTKRTIAIVDSFPARPIPMLVLLGSSSSSLSLSISKKRQLVSTKNFSWQLLVTCTSSSQLDIISQVLKSASLRMSSHRRLRQGSLEEPLLMLVAYCMAMLERVMSSQMRGMSSSCLSLLMLNMILAFTFVSRLASRSKLMSMSQYSCGESSKWSMWFSSWSSAYSSPPSQQSSCSWNSESDQLTYISLPQSDIVSYKFQIITKAPNKPNHGLILKWAQAFGSSYLQQKIAEAYNLEPKHLHHECQEQRRLMFIIFPNILIDPYYPLYMTQPNKINVPIIKPNDIIFIEEMEREFVIPVISKDGRQMSMEVRQKNHQLSKRKVKTWTNEEDAQLLELYERLPKKWSEIAALMTDRNENQCLHRYRRLVQLGKSHKIWSSQEDETILKLIKKYGKNWKLISEMLGSKNGKQIRQRYINKLDPRIKREDWSQEEDRKILELFSKIGSKWSEISKNLPGRPENKIKNRFYSYIQKNYDIKFKEVENIDPTERSAQKQQWKTAENKPALQDTAIKSYHILQAKEENRLSQERIYSKLQIPSINEIEFQMKNQIPQSNNLLESVLRVDEDWRMGTNYQSIFELRSADFFPRLPS